MGERRFDAGDPRVGLIELYETALPQVYGYLLSRSGRQPVAEDLTAEVFLAAVVAVRRDDAPPVTTPWLIGTARHKLVDHWRRGSRESEHLHAVATDRSDPSGPGGAEDPWDEQLDALRVRAVLDRLASHHRAALTLRYVDDLPVPVVAALLGRTLHATEALLVRARAAFRRAYQTTGEEDDGAGSV